MAVVFKDNLQDVMTALNMGTREFLTEAGIDIRDHAKENTRVDTGQTRDGWVYQLNGDNEVIIGNPEKNAIWEEFGTGIYAEDENGAPSGKGRQTGWIYTDRHGDTYFTRGKKATHALGKARYFCEAKMDAIAQEKIGGAMK